MNNNQQLLSIKVFFPALQGFLMLFALVLFKIKLNIFALRHKSCSLMKCPALGKYNSNYNYFSIGMVSSFHSPPFSDSCGRIRSAAHRASDPSHKILPGAAVARRLQPSRVGRGLHAAAASAAWHQHTRRSVLH